MAEKYSITSDYINNQWQKWCNKRVGSIVSVKKREDVKKVEEVEDCFILEFDPNDLTHLHNDDNDDDDDDSDDDDDDDCDDNGDDCSEICGSVVCVKKREDVKKFEQVEDCFILDFDPFLDVDSVGFKFDKLSVSVKTEVFSDDNGDTDDDDDDDDDEDDDDVSILGVKGKVACRDYPHPRHLCGTHPFKKTSQEIHCKMCYCYVCDTPAPCKKWMKGCTDPSLKHCDATPDIPLWRGHKDLMKQKSKEG